MGHIADALLRGLGADAVGHPEGGTVCGGEGAEVCCGGTGGYLPRAADLAAVIALASSYLDRAVPAQLVAIGEVGLTGELRNVNQLSQRISEAHRLGFTKCIIPMQTKNAISAPPNLELIQVRNIGEAIRAALRPAE